MKSKDASRLIKSFFIKVMGPACFFAVISYFLLLWARPGMPEGLRLFFSLMWIGLPFVIVFLAIIEMAWAGTKEIIATWERH